MRRREKKKDNEGNKKTRKGKLDMKQKKKMNGSR